MIIAAAWSGFMLVAAWAVVECVKAEVSLRREKAAMAASRRTLDD